MAISSEIAITESNVPKMSSNVNASVPSTSKNLFECVLCNKKLSDQIELQAHFRSHASDKPRTVSNQFKIKNQPVICDICNAEFANNTSAIQHKFRKHPNDHNRNHCSICGMSFPLKAFLEKHKVSHEGAVRGKGECPCPICGAVFDNLPALRYHSSTMHVRVMKLFRPIVTAPPSNKIKFNNAGELQSVYFCHLCGTEYVMKFNLQKHLENFHTPEEREATPTEMIRCTACDALFYNKKAYENHNLGHKQDDLYVTDEKQRLQMVRRVDQDFDVRRVQSVADKYVPTYKKRRKVLPVKVEDKDDDSSLSPPSSPGSTDSESDNMPLKTLAAS